MLPFVLNKFLGALTLPHLEELAIIAKDGGGMWTGVLMQEINSLISRSACKPKHLLLSPPRLLTLTLFPVALSPPFPVQDQTLSVLASVQRLTLVETDCSHFEDNTEHLIPVHEKPTGPGPSSLLIITSDIKSLVFYYTVPHHPTESFKRMSVKNTPSLKPDQREFITGLEELSHQGLVIQLRQ